MKKLLRGLVAIAIVWGLASSVAACGRRVDIPTPNSGMSATEYLKSSDREDWLSSELKSASLAVRDGNLGRDSDASPGKIATPFVTMEVELRQNGQPNFRRPVRLEVEPTDAYPSISFKLLDDGRWDVCLGTSGCSGALADSGMGATDLADHEEKAVETLREVLDTLVRPA